MTQQYAPPARSQAPSADPRAAGATPHEALRHHIVTAVLVTHDGGRWLGPVLQSLLNQRRPVQRIIAVDTGSRDNSVQLLESALGRDEVLHRKRSTGYGAAVAFGLKSSPPVGYDEFGYDSPHPPVEWIWLLHDDSEPAPDALGQLLLTAEDEPDAAVLGPKIRGWYDRGQLLEVGATVASNGRRWTGLERNEHDQGQHDETRPVLSVSSAGMLVRRDVWDRLRGFERGISLFRDDLDFCWRVNNAGYKVVIAPDAVLYHAEASARERRRITAGPNRPHLLDRSHALFTVAVNKDSRFWPALWLRLIVGSFFRALGFIIAKQPGTGSDELFAMLGFAARPDRILRGRSARRKMRAAGPEAIDQFFPPRGALARTAFDTIWSQLRGEHGESEQDSSRHRSVETGPVSEEAEVLDTDSSALIKRLIRNPIIAVGGGLTLITLVAGRGLLVGGSLAGGALLPTPGGASDLWSAYASGWHSVGLGTTSYAPPYLGILAIVATLLFGKASWAVSVLLIGSVPLAGLSASYAFRRITSSAPLRIWAGYAYALLAVGTGAIASGRLGTAVAVALLPLIVTTATQAVGGPGRSGSTRFAWTGAFLLTIATAFAPVVWVLALVFGVLATLTVAWRTRSNVAVTAIRMSIVIATPIVVLAPWSLSLLRHPSSFFLEIGLPGVDLTKPAPTPIGLLLGNPGGPGTYPAWFGVGLLLAALAALLRGTRRRVVVSAWALALVGFGSAVVIAAQKVIPPGSNEGVVSWPGVSTAMLGLGLITATVVGAEGARQRIATAAFGWRQPLTVLITGAAVLAPAAAGAWWLIHGANGPITRVTGQILPPYVAAEGQTPARPRTLLLTNAQSGAIGYSIVRDAGPTLGAADLRVSQAQNNQVDAVVGQLLSGNGGDAAQQLAALDVRYVMVSPKAPAAIAQALNGVAGLTERSLAQGGGGTQYGLWSVNGNAGRITVQDQKGNVLPTVYQCPIASAPKGSAQVCAEDANATVTVPAGAPGRVLVLAEEALSGWSATMNGQKLSATNLPHGLQGWQLPATGGTVTVGYSSVKHTVWFTIGIFTAIAATIMALPFGRRPDEEIEGEEAAELDAAGQPANAPEPRLDAGQPGLESEFAPEPQPQAQPQFLPEVEPEPEPEWERYPVAASVPEPEPAPVPESESETAQRPESEPDTMPVPDYGPDPYQSGAYEAAQYQTGSYQPAEYQTGGYQTSYEQYPMSNADPYTEDQHTYQQQGAYDQGAYDSGAYQYGQYDAGQYQSAEQYQDPAAQQYQDPGQYEQAGHQQAEHQQAPYEQSAYGQYSEQQYAGEQYSADQYGSQQPADQQYSGQQYGDPQYGDPQYSDQHQQYSGQQYSGQQYGEQQYGDQQHGGQQYGDQQYGDQQYGDYSESPGYGYAVPEQRQPDEPPAQHQHTHDQYATHDPYGHEYDPEGYGPSEQDGRTR